MKTTIALLMAILMLSFAAFAQQGYGNYQTTPSQSTATNMISNGPVAETVSDSSAVIGWSTKNPAETTNIRYGTDRGHMTHTAQVQNNADGKNHHSRLENLDPNTTYYFQVVENGHDVGGIGTFKTVAQGESPLQSKAVIPQK